MNPAPLARAKMAEPMNVSPAPVLCADVEGGVRGTGWWLERITYHLPPTIAYHLYNSAGWWAGWLVETRLESRLALKSKLHQVVWWGDGVF